ncbi:MAG TPA: alkaline phosphatase family protein [Candidatus Krumholzibacteria bacterium]|nr:alkaline phosphatase family protein [Candidatus Krumholzibacteria bacterium]HPD72673.1 alkaline phosphatase family protein [Candidatus Krumholzibacteria bacterium]HRY40395.1 alkaline phosphatase family protein [Candidatus Krumholzibacteria bacterium]
MKRSLSYFLALMALFATPAAAARVVVLGFDGMDPRLVAEYRARGLMPSFDRVIAGGGQLVPLSTAIPPQSPVAWSTFITGRDPGGHGIFDFIHRDPATLAPYLSTSEAVGPSAFWDLGSWRLPRGGGAVTNLRHGTAFWQLLDLAEVDATVFKVPANFPPVATGARTLSGMGTPDIQGTYGQYTYVTDDPLAARDRSGGALRAVYLVDGRCETVVEGPANVYREGEPAVTVPLAITVDPASRAALVELGGERLLLCEGEWSDWVRLEFTLVPWLKSVRGVARVFLMEIAPNLRLYVTPVQIDPAAPEMPISTPAGYARELAAALGPFFTQGLPADTKALEEGAFTDEDYLSQSDLVFAERKRQLAHELARLAGRDEGFLFFYFNYPDQDCHMWWRGIDPRSPLHAACAAEHHGRIPEIYQALDGVLGGVLDTVGPETLVMVMSDHGFAPYHRSFHVNTWLLEQGYLALQPGVARGDVAYLEGIDWSRTRAYAIGINGLYLNLRGREMRGIVAPGAEAEALLAELASRLEAAIDPALQAPAIKYAYRASAVYHGEYATSGPDIVLGYHRGWRGSNESALGEVPPEVFVDNEQKWSGDHCQAADEVPGILLSTRPLAVADPGLADLAPTILRLFGVAPAPEMTGRDLFGLETAGR